LETKLGVLLLDDGCGESVADADADADVVGCDWLKLGIDDDGAELAS